MLNPIALVLVVVIIIVFTVSIYFVLSNQDNSEKMERIRSVLKTVKDISRMTGNAVDNLKDIIFLPSINGTTTISNIIGQLSKTFLDTSVMFMQCDVNTTTKQNLPQNFQNYSYKSGKILINSDTFRLTDQILENYHIESLFDINILTLTAKTYGQNIAFFLFSSTKPDDTSIKHTDNIKALTEIHRFILNFLQTKKITKFIIAGSTDVHPSVNRFCVDKYYVKDIKAQTTIGKYSNIYGTRVDNGIFVSTNDVIIISESLIESYANIKVHKQLQELDSVRDKIAHETHPCETLPVVISIENFNSLLKRQQQQNKVLRNNIFNLEYDFSEIATFTQMNNTEANINDDIALLKSLISIKSDVTVTREKILNEAVKS